MMRGSLRSGVRPRRYARSCGRLFSEQFAYCVRGGRAMSSSHVHQPTLSAPRTQEVSDGIFAYIQPDGSWFLNNTGFLVGRDGVVSIDTTSTERRTRDYLAAARP